MVALSSDGITLLLIYKDYTTPLDGPVVAKTAKDQKKLTKVACGGDRCVIAVIDHTQTLWIREDTSWAFPEGYSWSRLMNGVCDVSVDMDNVLWVILADHSTLGEGVLAEVYDVSDKQKMVTQSDQREKLSCLKKKYEAIVHPIGPRIKHICGQSFSRPVPVDSVCQNGH